MHEVLKSEKFFLPGLHRSSSFTKEETLVECAFSISGLRSYNQIRQSSLFVDSCICEFVSSLKFICIPKSVLGAVSSGAQWFSTH